MGDSVVFILARRDEAGEWRLLMERRGDGGPHPNAWLFPAGKAEEGEPPTSTLLRECEEELAVLPFAARLLADGEDYFYCIGRHAPVHRMHPFLVTRWRGDVPDRVLDTGAELAWRPLDDALASPVPVTGRMALAAAKYLRGG